MLMIRIKNTLEIHINAVHAIDHPKHSEIYITLLALVSLFLGHHDTRNGCAAYGKGDQPS